MQRWRPPSAWGPVPSALCGPGARRGSEGCTRGNRRCPMGCVDRGELRAYLDGELAAGRGGLVESHLASCDSCRQECEALGRNASFARSAMDVLAPLPSQLPMPRLSGVRDVVRRGEMSPVTPLERIGDMMKNLAR